MANNRMVLLCNVCQPDDTKWKFHEVGVQALAKWYPGEDGSYYGIVKESVDAFLIAHQHQEVQAGGMEYPIRMVYECPKPGD